MTERVLALLVLMLVPLAARAEDRAQPKSASPLIQANYPVADLVVPIPGLDIPLNAGKQAQTATKENWLLDKIQRSVSPDSWQAVGGQGTVRYVPAAMSVVVSQPAAVQAQVKDLLETMRRAQNIQVAVEMRVVEINTSGFTKLRASLPNLSQGDVLLSDLEVLGLLALVQDNRGPNVVQAPKVTCFPGQRVKIAANTLDVELSSMVACNLRDIDLNVRGAFGNARFERATRLADGANLVLTARNSSNGATLLLVKPRIILNLEESVTTSEANASNVVQTGVTQVSPAPLLMPPAASLTHTGKASVQSPTQDPKVVHARLLEASQLKPLDAAAAKATAYPVPQPLEKPKHLFHLIFRYEGDSLADSMAGVVKSLAGAEANKEEAADKSGAEASKVAPSLNSLLHFIVRYEGEGIIDSNVVEMIKHLAGAGAMPSSAVSGPPQANTDTAAVIQQVTGPTAPRLPATPMPRP